MGIVGLQGTGAPLSQLLSSDQVKTIVITTSSDYLAEFGELIRNRSDVVIVKMAPQQMSVSSPLFDPAVATTIEEGKAGQRTEKPLATLERAKPLTTQQAWEIAKARGCIKSRDAFRAWSRRSPEKCRELYELIVVTEPQQGKLIGYQDDQANETLEK